MENGMTWPAYRYSLFVFVLALGKTVIIIIPSKPLIYQVVPEDKF
jgi:hypothetical protein